MIGLCASRLCASSNAFYSAQGCKLTVCAARHRSSCRAVRQSARRSLYVAAFKEQKGSEMTFPLDFYKVLTVSKSSSPEVVRVAYQRQLRNPPDVGYSQDTLFSRAVLLRDAAECLQNQHSRRLYDSMARAVDVSAQYLPAALVLLQESGDSELVIKLGTEWLHSNSHDQLACDVAAAVALAHCDVAAEALEQDSSTVLRACQNLEVSLQLLRQHRMAPQLQQQIMQTLEDYSPHYCLELLALPLDDSHQKQRQRGMILLRKLAYDLPQELSPVALQDRDSFLSSARSLLAPQELLGFYKALPATSSLVGHQQKLDMALAMTALGYQQQQPHMVQQAASMYQQIHKAAAKEGHAMDLSVERAACALMLGDMQQAQRLLGLAGSSSNFPAAHADDNIAAFVSLHSPDEGDLLPGIYVLSESWLQEGVLAGFRQNSHMDQEERASLADWFNCKTVQTYIEAHALLRSISILKAIRFITDAIAACCSWVAKAIQGGLTISTTQSINCIASQSMQLQPQQPAQVQQNLHAVSADGPADLLDRDTGSNELQEQELDVSQLRQRWQAGEGCLQGGADTTGAASEQQRQLRALETAMWDSAQTDGAAAAMKPARVVALLLLTTAAAAALVVWFIRPRNTTALCASPSAEVWRLTGY